MFSDSVKIHLQVHFTGFSFIDFNFFLKTCVIKDIKSAHGTLVEDTECVCGIFPVLRDSSPYGLMRQHLYLFFLKILFIYFQREEKGIRKGGRETCHTYISWLPLTCPQRRTCHNPSRCPDWEGTDTKSTEPHWPGWPLFSYSHVSACL